MNIALWIIQIILASLFATAGILKTTRPIGQLVKTVNWADRFPVETVRLIGISEVVGAIGLIIPWAMDIVPVLTPVAAAGFALMQVLAILHHTNHRERATIMFNLLLLSMALFVAFGRYTTLR